MLIGVYDQEIKYFIITRLHRYSITWTSSRWVSKWEKCCFYVEFGIHVLFKFYVALQHHNAVKGKYFPHFMLPIILPRNIPDKTVKEHNVALHELFECVFLNIVSYSNGITFVIYRAIRVVKQYH